MNAPRGESGGDICPGDEVRGVQGEAHVSDLARAIVSSAIGRSGRVALVVGGRPQKIRIRESAAFVAAGPKLA